MRYKRPTFSFLILHSLFLILLASCSVGKQIARSANEDVLTNKALKTAHVGISIFDPAENKYLYNYQGDKYFVPASNTKLPTCYAAMKYLGDSLVGLQAWSNADSLMLFPSGDPTFLHKDFKKHPVLEFLQSEKFASIYFVDTVWGESELGSGWSWNDFNEYYMVERSSFPIYGNVYRFSGSMKHPQITPHLDDYASDGFGGFVSSVLRDKESNRFSIEFKSESKKLIEVPFLTWNGQTNIKFLEDTIHKNIVFSHQIKTNKLKDKTTTIHSQPTDSLLKPMMHRSDNFFAEQSLLMVSNEMLGYMNDEKIIDTLLKTDFKDLPQKPRWADGSGLSRYNLFTPQDFVAILNKMKNEFGMERIKVILPTGGEGTISSYYKADSGYIYGKTGTLSGVVAFSGFLYTKKGKLLIFSTLVNNHQASATDVRRAVEKFLQGIRARY